MKETITDFKDLFSITIYDPGHSMDEDRYLDVGLASNGRILVTSYTERGENIRIISVREATRRERRAYEGR